ncbi:MAG: DUF5723 family protein [Bacteroidota bacterium]
MQLRYLLGGLFLYAALALQAQQATNLNFQNNLWQANRTNPAFLPDANFVIGLPSVANAFDLDQNTLSDWIDTENGIITLDAALPNISPDNSYREYFELETLSLGVSLGDWHLSVHHALKLDAGIEFPRTLAQVIGNGNAQFIGETLDLGHTYRASNYSEFGIGIGYRVTDQLTLGTRIKYLNGLGNVDVERGELFLTTDEEIYALELNADYRVNTAGLVNYNGLNAEEGVFETSMLAFDRLFSQNTGVAFDVGAELALEDWTIAFSLLDIGSIQWEEDAQNYAAVGTYDYGGFDLIDAFLNDSVAVNTVLDSLNQLFVVEESSNSYTTTLPRRAYIHLSHEFSEDWRGGVILFGEWYREELRPAVSLQAQRKFGDILQIGANYTLANGHFDQLGLNLQAKLGPVQVFAMTHQVLNVVRPRESNVLDVRLGANLLFGE